VLLNFSEVATIVKSKCVGTFISKTFPCPVLVPGTRKSCTGNFCCPAARETSLALGIAAFYQYSVRVRQRLSAPVISGPSMFQSEP